MSEYQEKHTVARLIGAPPGYVGYDEGGQLTEAVRRRPYSVALFDESEKAHPDVFNVLLQILDDGRLTDGQGRTVDFRNTVIVMTSNLGGDDALRAHFRPEFLNRVDDVIVFQPLSQDELGRIVDIQLRRLEARLAERKLGLRVTDPARKLLAERGWDPVYGARPLKRAIQRFVQDRLALLVLQGEFSECDVVEVDAAAGDLTFRRGAGSQEPDADSPGELVHAPADRPV
jgi:ATP-dependent Clp protease ATP-binding subunit ClpB